MDELNNVKTKDKSIEEDNEGLKVLEDAENIIKQSNNLKHTATKKFLIFFVVPLIVLVILLVILSTIFALINMNNSNIIQGVFIQGVEVSNLSTEEAKNKITSIVNDHISKEITLKYGDFTKTLVPTQFDVNFDADNAISTAYSIGRNGNIFENNYAILNALLNSSNVGQNMTYDTDLLNALLVELNNELPGRMENSGYYVDGTNLVIDSGKEGVNVDTEVLANKITKALNDITNNEIIIEIPVVNVAPNPIDLDSIYNEIHKDPIDAYYTTNPYVVYPSSTGLDFNISMDEAKEMLKTYQEQYTIPLKVTYPNVSTNDIGSEAFPDLLSSFRTSFTSSNSNRSTNIRLCSEKINGTILMPGETFSFNQVVGKRTPEAGFKPATAYSNGEVVQEYGGGICQVSSTLYNAVLYANLEITERTNHGYKPTYVDPGLDATVSWGGPDFKFTNNRDYPIRIVCDTSNKILNIYIYGLKRDTDYKVVLDAQYVSTINYKTVYQKDSSLASGQSRVIQSGSNGCKTATYKYLYDANGTLVSSECISRDTYNPHNKIVAVGK